MAVLANQRATDRGSAAAQGDGGVQLDQAHVGVSRGNLREAGLQEHRSAFRTTPLSPGNLSNALSAESTVMSQRRIAHLQDQLGTTLSGVPITRENILANPEARQIQLEILKIARSIEQPVIGLAPRSSGQKPVAGVANSIRADNHIYAVQLLQADMRQVLGDSPATPENILANAEARKIQLKILDHVSEFGQVLSPGAAGAIASTGTKNATGPETIKSRLSAIGGLQAQAISTQRIQIYQADLNDALRGAVATPENILANADARRAQRLIIGEAAKISAAPSLSETSPNSGIASAAGSLGGAQNSPGARSTVISTMVTGTMADMSVSLLNEDVRRALGGAGYNQQNILGSSDAREAQFHILAIRANHIDATERALKGTGRVSQSGHPSIGQSVAKAHITQQMMAICHAEINDALSGKDATPAAIAGNSRAFAAYQRMQFLASGNLAAVEATLNPE